MEDYPQHKDEKKPLWQEWPDRPVPLRTTQLLTRAVGCLFELAVVVYYLWFSARCPDRFSQAATGFSAVSTGSSCTSLHATQRTNVGQVLVGLFMDAYEAYMMASRERDFPVNPCAICVDFLVLIVGFVGLWLLVFSDRTTELQLLQPPNDAQSVAGGLLVATL